MKRNNNNVFYTLYLHFLHVHFSCIQKEKDAFLTSFCQSFSEEKAISEQADAGRVALIRREQSRAQVISGIKSKCTKSPMKSDFCCLFKFASLFEWILLNPSLLLPNLHSSVVWNVFLTSFASHERYILVTMKKQIFFEEINWFLHRFKTQCVHFYRVSSRRSSAKGLRVIRCSKCDSKRLTGSLYIFTRTYVHIYQSILQTMDMDAFGETNFTSRRKFSKFLSKSNASRILQSTRHLIKHADISTVFLFESYSSSIGLI